MRQTNSKRTRRKNGKIRQTKSEPPNVQQCFNNKDVLSIGAKSRAKKKKARQTPSKRTKRKKGQNLQRQMSSNALATWANCKQRRIQWGGAKGVLPKNLWGRACLSPLPDTCRQMPHPKNIVGCPKKNIVARSWCKNVTYFTNQLLINNQKM